MDILRDYAANHDIDYSELLADFISSPREEQEDFLMQIGGESPSGGSAEVEQILMAYAEMTGTPYEQIREEFAYMPEEQQAQLLQQIVGTIQQTQAQAQGQSQEAVMAQTGIPVTEEGYYTLDPMENPYAYIPTENGDITMQGIEYPINAYDGNTGQFLETMLPNQDYSFDTDLVLEEPLYAQKGLTVNTDPNIDTLITRLYNKTKNPYVLKIKTKRDLLKFYEYSKKHFPNALKEKELEAINSLEEDFDEAAASKKVFQEREARLLREKNRKGYTFANSSANAGAIENPKAIASSIKKGANVLIKKASEAVGGVFSKEKTPAEDRPNSGGGFGALKQLAKVALTVNSKLLETDLDRAFKDRPSLGAVVGMTNPVVQAEDYSIPQETSAVQKDFTVYNNDREAPSLKIDPVNTPSPKRKTKVPLKKVQPTNTPSTDPLFTVTQPTDEELQGLVNGAGTPPGARAATPIDMSKVVGLGNGVADNEWVDPNAERTGKSTANSTAADTTTTKRAKPILSKINSGTGLFSDFISAGKIARGFGATAPVFRGQARLNFAEQPLIDFRPVADSVRSMFNDAIRNINANSTVGASMISHLQGQAMNNLTKAANDVATQNGRIQAQNNSNRVNALNEMRERQLRYDMGAYDQQLRRSAARDASIDNATNEFLKIQNSKRERRMMFDTLPLLYDGIEEVSTPFDRLFGTRKYSQNPNLKLNYTPKSTEKP